MPSRTSESGGTRLVDETMLGRLAGMTAVAMTLGGS